MWLLFITSDLRDIRKTAHQWEDHILPARLDKRLKPAVSPKIEQFDMRLPEDDADVRRDT